MAVKATAVNPNTSERIAKVLDDIIEEAEMKNKYSVKIVVRDNKVTKVLNTNKEFRKHILVTADGLPYKIMIDLIENVHMCVQCGKKLLHLSICNKNDRC